MLSFQIHSSSSGLKLNGGLAGSLSLISLSPISISSLVEPPGYPIDRIKNIEFYEYDKDIRLVFLVIKKASDTIKRTKAQTRQNWYR